MVSHTYLPLSVHDFSSLGCKPFIGQCWEWCWCYWCYWSWQPSRPWFGRAPPTKTIRCIHAWSSSCWLLMKSFNFRFWRTSHTDPLNASLPSRFEMTFSVSGSPGRSSPCAFSLPVCDTGGPRQLRPDRGRIQLHQLIQTTQDPWKPSWQQVPHGRLVSSVKQHIEMSDHLFQIWSLSTCLGVSPSRSPWRRRAPGSGSVSRGERIPLTETGLWPSRRYSQVSSCCTHPSPQISPFWSFSPSLILIQAGLRTKTECYESVTRFSQWTMSTWLGWRASRLGTSWRNSMTAARWQI